MTTLEVVGIDPSLTSTGIARITAGGGTEVLTIKSDPHHTLRQLRDRIRYITGQALRFAPKHCLTVFEAPIIPHGHTAGGVLERAWLYGLLVDQFATRGLVAAASPATRAQYALRGNASKSEVLEAIRTAFPHIAIRDDNQADALALAAMGARHLGHPIDGEPNEAQQRAMSAVRWPNPKEMQ